MPSQLHFPGHAAGPLIRRAVVLGAGTMGARIAAHLANHGTRVHLLDLPGPAEDRSRAARLGLEAALRSKPAAFFQPELAGLIETGNFEDHAAVLGTADWVIEAVVENLEVKRELLARLAPFLAADAILTTNTSGIPIAAIGEGLPPEVRRRWFGTHFFNPPRYLRLLEIIPSPWSEAEAMERIAAFADQRLGKNIVRCRDTPNFIANRIGTYSLVNTLRHMERLGLTVDEVDALTGPVLGWPRSATFRTLDVVGLDTLAHVIRNSYESLPEDEQQSLYRVPPVVEEMLRRGWLGEKSGQGFYRKTREADGGSAILTLDLETWEYRGRRKPSFASLEVARGIDDLGERLRATVWAGDRAGEFLRGVFIDLFLYAAARIPEIAENVSSLDRAMRWGFNWEMGPFEIWDALGFEAVLERMRVEGRELPPLVAGMVRNGARGFYQWKVEAAGSLPQLHVYSGVAGKPVAVEEPEGVLRLAPLRRGGREARRNSGCSLIDLGDGIGCLEFHSKMNAIGPDIVQMVSSTLRDEGAGFEGFVLSGEAENFSVGANLLHLLLLAQEEDWEEIDLAVRAFQGMTMAVRHCPRPVIVAPFGMTLGGGCELMLNAARVVAHAELYAGLVEVGVGLIPAGGGSAEMARRAVRSALELQASGARGESVEVQESVRRAFETIALAKTSTSAAEARALGLLRASDPIVANRDRLLHEARAEARRLADAGYVPPEAEVIPAPGTGVYQMLRLGVYLMREAQYISDHEQKIALHLARVLTGGDRPAGSALSEPMLLDLEREAFLSLCGEAKTLERIQYTLKTGKTLRN